MTKIKKKEAHFGNLFKKYIWKKILFSTSTQDYKFIHTHFFSKNVRQNFRIKYLNSVLFRVKFISETIFLVPKLESSSIKGARFNICPTIWNKLWAAECVSVIHLTRRYIPREMEFDQRAARYANHTLLSLG